MQWHGFVSHAIVVLLRADSKMWHASSNLRPDTAPVLHKRRHTLTDAAEPQHIRVFCQWPEDVSPNQWSPKFPPEIVILYLFQTNFNPDELFAMIFTFKFWLRGSNAIIYHAHAGPSVIDSKWRCNAGISPKLLWISVWICVGRLLYQLRAFL